MVARATASSASELTAHLGGQLSQTLASQTEQQNFNRKISQSSVTNGVVGDASRLAATPTPVTTALEAQTKAVKALQSTASAASMALTTAELADSFDSLKKLSDRLPDSLSMEKLDDRDVLKMDLSGDSAPRDPNVKVFEHNETFSSSNKKLVTNEFSTQEARENREESTHMQEGDNSYSKKQSSSDMRAKLEMNGVTAEKGLSTKQVSDLGAKSSHGGSSVSVLWSVRCFSVVFPLTSGFPVWFCSVLLNGMTSAGEFQNCDGGNEVTFTVLWFSYSRSQL